MAVLPDIGAANFAAPTTIDNQYFPLLPGTIKSYGGSVIDPESGETQTERNDVVVTSEARTIEGINVVVVRDTAYGNGLLIEDTLDYYAQDNAGHVWYLGEIVINSNYDGNGNFVDVDFDGSWQFGVAGAQPGWIMEANPQVGDNYFQEFLPGTAVDEGTVAATGLNVDIGLGSFSNVIKTLDTSVLHPDVGAFKYFAPGVGQVFEQEIVLADPDNPELVTELENIRLVDNSAAVDPTALAFEGDGTEKTITFLTEDGSANGAIGAYTFDAGTGEIGEGRILFANTEDAAPGDSVTVTVGAGESLGLFLIPNVDGLGIELENYMGGGLHFRNFLSGEIADLYDGDPATTFEPGPATIFDGLGPLVTDAGGNILPIQAFHSVGNRDGFNFLNAVAGENARAGDAGDDVAGVEVVAFEDGLASTAGYDGDFNDAFLAVSAAPLSEPDLGELLDEIDISRIVGSDGRDKIRGTAEDDQIIGLDGKDRLNGRAGDDVIEAGGGGDCVEGGDGDDKISGEGGRDELYGGDGEDEIDGGDGNDRLKGGDGEDLLEGGAGRDTLKGGDGYDTLLGGEGKDTLIAGDDGARMSGGARDDTMRGERCEADTFVFDLIPFGNDLVLGFENGTDLIEIAMYTGVSSFCDVDVEQHGNATVLAFADGTVTLAGVNAGMIDASDFDFV